MRAQYPNDVKGQDVKTSCAPKEGTFPMTTPEGSAMFKNPNGVGFPPCVNGSMTHLPGSTLPWTAPEAARDYSVKGKFRVPANLHMGIIGLAQATGVPQTRSVGLS